MASDAPADAEAGFLPRFLGAVCGCTSSCSDFLFLPGRDLGTTVGVTTFEVVEVVPEVDSALPKGILTNSLPGVFSTTRFMATPSVACRTFPLPLGRPRPRPDGFTTFCFLGGRFSRREGLPRPVTVKSKSLGSVVVSPTFWKYAISSTLERNAFPSELIR